MSIFDSQFDNWLAWSRVLKIVVELIDLAVKARALRAVLDRPVVGSRIRTALLTATRAWKFRRRQRILEEHESCTVRQAQHLQDVEVLLSRVARPLGPGSPFV